MSFLNKITSWEMGDTAHRAINGASGIIGSAMGRDLLNLHKDAYLSSHRKAISDFEEAGQMQMHNAFGFSLVMAPKVYMAHPELSHSSGIVIDNLGDDLTGKTVLDVGCGTGVISLAAAYRGAAFVLATDYSEDAVAVAFHNKQVVNAQQRNTIRVQKADVLEGVRENNPYHRFDIVAANLWFPVRYDDGDSIEMAQNAYHRLFGEVRHLMKPDGIAHVTSAEFAEVDALYSVMDAHGIEPHLTVADKLHYGGNVPVRWHLYSFDRDGRPVDPAEWAVRQGASAPSP